MAENMPLDIETVLSEARSRDASDIHLVAGEPPILRVDTHLLRMNTPPISEQELHALASSMLDDDQRDRFATEQDVDLAWTSGDARFRVNAHWQSGTPAFALRSVRTTVPALADLGLPDAIGPLADLPRGLILVTGDTGSGKSTTLAALIDRINREQSRHIITLEDPVEYTFCSDQCLIEQRELGRDMPSFASGLRHALRQDPDVILVGEMRDLETTSLAISAAETGHLVLSTLHTVNAAQTVERIVDMYPSTQQGQVRSMLADTLRAVLSQTLLPRKGGGMAAAVEVLLCDSAVRNIIREARTFEIPNVIETGGRKGMVSRDAAIAMLVLNGVVEEEAATAAAHDPTRLTRNLAA